MDIKGQIDFYLKIIPALSSPGWQDTDNPTFDNVIAWHILRISDPDIEIRGRICIQNMGTIPHYFVQLDSAKRAYPTFTITAPLQLALFESYTKPIIQPTFAELEAEALRVARELITEKKAGWIEKRNDWLEQTSAMK